jgi:hypothetical protein
MSGSITLVGGQSSGPAGSTANNTFIDLTSGFLSVTGTGDTLVSSASDAGVTMTAGNNFMSITGSNDTITAGNPAAQPSSGDSLFLGGENNIVNDAGFNDGNVTIGGSQDGLFSNQDIEQTNIVLNGSNDTVSAVFMSTNMVINGNNEDIDVGSGNFTINGSNDTVTTANAKTIIDAGANNTILNEAIPGDALPTNIFSGGGSTTTPGTAITVTGAGASVTSLNNNDTVVSSGGQTSITLSSFNNSVVASGSGTNISTESTNETISAAGANSTVSTAPSFIPSSAPPSSVTFTGNASVGAVFNDGSSSNSDTAMSSVPITINVNTSNSSIDAQQGDSVNDSIGGNHLTIGSGTFVNVTNGNDTVNISNNSFIFQDTISGGAKPNVINFGSGDEYIGKINNMPSSNNVLNFMGNDDGAILYAADQDTVNVVGNNGQFQVAPNSSTFLSAPSPNTPSMPDTVGTVFNVSGDDTVSFQTSFNTINGSNGSMFFIDNSNNTLTGSGISAQIQGDNNVINVTGSDTIVSASPFSYQTMPEPDLTTQNFMTVQSGQFSLGGQDVLLQTQGTAAISLFGGNAVTLNGSNDTVAASDQLYGGNNIVNNGANNQILLQDVSASADTITANASTFVNIEDLTSKAFGNVGNSNEKLDFINGTGSASTIIASASQAAVTFSGGASANNVVYGGLSGNNSLNGGTGSGDLFKAGGTNDILTGGSGGNNTLVSAAGNETFTGSSMSTDLFSITGGGGTDLIQNFTGSLQLANGLSVETQTTTSGSLSLLLNDGTQVIFSGLTNISQTGNTFRLPT